MEMMRNIIALIRGNAKCFFLSFQGGIKYNCFMRIFAKVQLVKEKKGSIFFEKGISIGMRSIIKVRENAYLFLGEMSSLNADCKIVCQEKIVIGKNTILGPNVMIFDHDHDFNSTDGVKRQEFKKGEIIIGENCWIGAGSIILRGTNIGDNCVIAAGSIVKGKIDSDTLFVQKRSVECIKIK